MALGLTLMSCGTSLPTSAPSSTASSSPSSTESVRPSTTAQPEWKTFVSARWSYSIDYPGDWYNLPNFGAPDTEKYFSNENVGAPQMMTQYGVWETIEVQPTSHGPCPPSYVSRYAIRQSPTTVDGVATTRYVINMTPSGAEAAYIIGVWASHKESCFSIQFLSQSPSTRDAAASVADQAIASFRFGS